MAKPWVRLRGTSQVGASHHLRNGKTPAEKSVKEADGSYKEHD